MNQEQKQKVKDRIDAISNYADELQRLYVNQKLDSVDLVMIDKLFALIVAD